MKNGPGALRRDIVTNGPPALYGAIGERVRLRAGATRAAIYLTTWCKLYSGENHGRDGSPPAGPLSSSRAVGTAGGRATRASVAD